MSEHVISFAFCCNADRSAHDHTMYVNGNARDQRTVTLGARYKNSEPSHLYEIEMDADDLECFGALCQSVARLIRTQEPGV